MGYAICLIDIYMGMYYNTIIGWAVYYLFASFSTELPWTKCGNPWNTDACMPVTSLANASSGTLATLVGSNVSLAVNGTIGLLGNVSSTVISVGNVVGEDIVRTSPAREFFE